MNNNDTNLNKSDEQKADFSSLRALFINCTLKKSPEQSHTEGLMKLSRGIMDRNRVKTEMVRPVDHEIAHGIYPDMTEHGWKRDDWPMIFEKVKAADILVMGTPIWLGDISSVCNKTIERFYAMSGKLNDKGQYLFYGKTAGCIITGNEDGIKHCARTILYAMQHVGYLIPPQADAGWIGEAGPGPSYLDENSGGPENEFTNRNTTFMTWNLMHLARMLKQNGGIPVHGNQKSKWDDGYRFDLPDPQKR